MVHEVDPITLIVTALAAGAASGAISANVAVAYSRLRGLAKKRVAGSTSAELVLAEHEANPEIWEAPLAAKLTELGADSDSDLVAAAKAVLELVDANGAKSGKYNVTVRGSQGVQIGEGNVQFNRFNSPPGRPDVGR